VREARIETYTVKGRDGARKPLLDLDLDLDLAANSKAPCSTGFRNGTLHLTLQFKHRRLGAFASAPTSITTRPQGRLTILRG